jgi:hypothetical protein
MLYIYYIMTMSNINAYLSSMVKRVLGILKLVMDLIMEYHRVRASGLKTKMVILRYDGDSHISITDTPHHAMLMIIGRLRIGIR